MRRFYSIAKKEEDIKPFEEFLDKLCSDKFANSLRDTFVFGVNQLLEFPDYSKKNTRKPPRCNTRITCNFKNDGNIGHWDTITEEGFKNDGHVGLWDCVMGMVKLMSVNMVNLEK